jgi:hypothetical protein
MFAIKHVAHRAGLTAKCQIAPSTLMRKGFNTDADPTLLDDATRRDDRL